MSKKAQMMMSPRKSISLILGFLLLILGILPVLKQFKVIGFSLPSNLPALTIFISILLIAGAIFLVYDGYDASMGMPGMFMFISVIIALVALAVGLIPLLFQLKVIGFNLPASLNIAIPWVYLVSGFFLIIGGFIGM